MAGEVLESNKTELALAVARGVSISKWARAKKVPLPTAYRWARDPEVRDAIEFYRRRIVDQAVGRMTKNSTKAAEIIMRLAERAESESVQLRAARSVFSDMINVSKYSGLEERMSEVEENLGITKSGKPINDNGTKHPSAPGAYRPGLPAASSASSSTSPSHSAAPPA